MADRNDQASKEARKTLEQITGAYSDTQYVALATRLGIADLLASGAIFDGDAWWRAHGALSGEFAHLFAAAGPRLTRIVPTKGFRCVIEAERAWQSDGAFDTGQLLSDMEGYVTEGACS